MAVRIEKFLIVVVIFLIQSADSTALAKDDAEIEIGPTIVHVSKPEQNIDYKICLFTYQVPNEKVSYSLSCPTTKTGECPQNLKECDELAERKKLVASPAVEDKNGDPTDERYRLKGRTCRYRSVNPIAIYMPIGDARWDVSCSTPVICEAEGQEPELSHTSCPALPYRVSVKGKEGKYPVCPKVKACEAKSYVTKDLGSAQRAKLDGRGTDRTLRSSSRTGSH